MNDQPSHTYHAPRLRSRTGSVAVELALAFVVVALTGWLVIEVIARVRQRHRCTAFVTELRQFEEVFRQFPPHPATIGPGGTLPRATAEALENMNWNKGSPFGGTYEWRPPRSLATGGLGTIGLTAFAPDFPLQLSRAELLRVDRQLDDGDPATGRFRTAFNGWPVFHLDDQR